MRPTRLFMVLLVVACAPPATTAKKSPAARATSLQPTPSAPSSASSGAGVTFVGRYMLDKNETTKAMLDGIERRPKSVQEGARIAAQMISAMDIEMALDSSGDATLRLKSGEAEVERGRWRIDGPEALLISSGNGKDTRCVQRDVKLVCVDKSGNGKVTMVFVRH